MTFNPFGPGSRTIEGGFRIRELLRGRDINKVGGEAIPDQKGKSTANPTMRRVFQIFEGISLLIESRNGVENIVGMINLREIHRKILKLLGSNYEKMYMC